MRQLYKYQSFNQHSLESVSENVIWVSKPSDFNDPFEYSFRIDSDMPMQEVLRRMPDATPENYLDKQLELIGGIKEEFEIGGVFSLSESNRISLMWSHYANSHYGFCIGYGVENHNHLGNGRCLPVDYGGYKSLGLMEIVKGIEKKDFDFGKKMYGAMVLSKDPNWKYERERRILYSQSSQLITPDFSIKSITFGLRMKESHRKILINLMGGKSVCFFQVEKRNDSYDLLPVPFKYDG